MDRVTSQNNENNSSRRSLSVMVVEDNYADFRLLQLQLKRAGYRDIQYEHCLRLSEGVEKLQSCTPDVILLDLSLPDSWGYESFENLNKVVSGIPIIILTGLIDEELAKYAVGQGAYRFLVKGQLSGNEMGQLLYDAVRVLA